MILRLFCPKCAFKAAKEKREKNSSRITIDVPMPVSQLKDDGRYEVHCASGHVSTVTVDNIKFELLFEMGLNALVDGYPRDAVSSFASALERYYEFYWHVSAAFYEIPENQAETAWKHVAKQSERQLGMFLTASLLLTKRSPSLLNPNKDVKLRNDVIHGGYVPSSTEAIDFGDIVMGLINESLAELRKIAPDALISTYKRLSPAPKRDDTASTATWNDNEDHTGVVNIITAIDVRHPVTEETDSRHGGVKDQFKRICREREPHQLTLLDETEPEVMKSIKKPPSDNV